MPSRRQTLKTPKFGAWLRERRGAASYEEFALRVRAAATDWGLVFDRSQIVKLEDGRLPSLPILYALAAALGTSVLDLEQRIAQELKKPGTRDLPRQKAALHSDLPPKGLESEHAAAVDSSRVVVALSVVTALGDTIKHFRDLAAQGTAFAADCTAHADKLIALSVEHELLPLIGGQDAITGIVEAGSDDRDRGADRPAPGRSKQA